MSFDKRKKILMIGWEFPPLNSGGLGVACKGLLEALIKRGVKISFVLPKKMEVSLLGADFRFVQENFQEILPPHFFSYYNVLQECDNKSFIMGNVLSDKVMYYAKHIVNTIKGIDFNLIHAHDWLTFPAAMAIKKIFKKPFIAHIHAIEFDRSGGGCWQGSAISLIEKKGLEEADKIIAVSQYTKDKIINCYNIDPEKIVVVHNGVAQETYSADFLGHSPSFFNNKKIVLFIGRLTLQKGVDWFLKAAKRVIDYDPDTIFIIAGDGDFKTKAIRLAADLNILSKVIFTGFLKDENLARVYQMGDLFVLSSVSEPFGIAPLEAVKYNTPVILSKNSGVSEVLKGALRVDFWDTDKMAEKILAVLNYRVLKNRLIDDSKSDLKSITWDKAAEKIERIYSEII